VCWSIIAVLAGYGAGMGWAHRKDVRQLRDEVTELQAAVDLVLLEHGRPPVFANRYGLDYVIDPTKVPPPEAPRRRDVSDELPLGAGWYRLDGHTPVRMRTPAEQYAEWERREQSIRDGEDCYRVARTKLGGERYVSTVFLGLDHGWMPGAPPLLFETMVFPECDVCERWTTWDQALAGHHQIAAAERSDSRTEVDDA
jgi:hypothetical protein